MHVLNPAPDRSTLIEFAWEHISSLHYDKWQRAFHDGELLLIGPAPPRRIRCHTLYGDLYVELLNY